VTASRPKILVIEDESAIADTITYALETEGFEAVWRNEARAGLAVLREHAIALVVLDVGLPDMNGFDVCRELRRLGNWPVIFVTARSGEVDRIVGLELGADDYLVKPFSPRELTARVRAIMRRTSQVAAGPDGSRFETRSGPARDPVTLWRHDAERCRIHYQGQALDLTRNEYRLLATLVAAPGRVFSRDQLMTAAWDDPGAALDRTVDAHVKSVRAKLRLIAPEADPIETHRGLGYSLREET
jgi:two-component system catabolic regulation response regulator CreB